MVCACAHRGIIIADKVVLDNNPSIICREQRDVLEDVSRNRLVLLLFLLLKLRYNFCQWKLAFACFGDSRRREPMDQMSAFVLY